MRLFTYPRRSGLWRRSDTNIVLVLRFAWSQMPRSHAVVTFDAETAEWLEANTIPLPTGLHVRYVADGGSSLFGLTAVKAPLNNIAQKQKAIQIAISTKTGINQNKMFSNHFSKRRGASLCRLTTSKQPVSAVVTLRNVAYFLPLKIRNRRVIGS